MEQIRAIQEIVDTNKGEIPTGVVVDLMTECQKAHNAPPPKLHRLTWIKVDAHAHVDSDSLSTEPTASVKLSHVEQTVIVEAFGHPPRDLSQGELCEAELPDNGMMLNWWLNAPKPIVLTVGNRPEDDALRIICSIEPFVPKRPRGEDE